MSIGYPDGQAYPQWVGAQLLTSPNPSCPVGSTPLGVVLVDAFAGLQLIFANEGFAGLSVTLTYSQDSAGLDVIDSFTWAVPIGVGLKALVPNEGPYAQLTVANAGGGTAVPLIYLAGTNQVTDRIAYPVTNNLVRKFNQSVAAGTTAVFPLPWVQGGWALLTYAPHDATGDLTFNIAEITSLLGNANTLAGLGAPAATTTIGPIQVPLVGDCCGLVVVNGDATNPHLFTASLVAGMGE